jgi:hypothetical protein
MENKISITVSAQTIQDALQAVNTLKGLLPELVTLTPDERRAYLKMGDKSLAFVQKAQEYAGLHPTLVPSFVNVAEMKKDIDAVTALQTIYRALNEIHSALDDSILLSGSEAFMAALTFYNAAKNAAKSNVQGAKEIADDLGTRFPGKKRKQAPVNP